MYGIAYRMLGTLTDAEDVVQDAYFRWQAVDLDRVESPRAYLATAVSRLCVDRLRRRKIEKLNYTGPWLPEPMPTDEAAGLDPESASMRAESISIAFLHLLERLTPAERGVFVLKEAFDIDHGSIATMLDIEVAHSRQLLRRARQRLGDIPASVHATPDEDSLALLQAFAEAAASGNMDKLKNMLAEDAISYSDGGGRASAALIPLNGRDKVSTVLMHLVQHRMDGVDFAFEIVNGGWGLVGYQDNEIFSVTTACIECGVITALYTMRNPAKLGSF